MVIPPTYSTTILLRYACDASMFGWRVGTWDERVARSHDEPIVNGRSAHSLASQNGGNCYVPKRALALP
eukprot:5592799-Pleurochrysis_carterae.AAC.1